jgi:putative toxin-antitoxin system antitoxin component (TIGR02293 family)
MAEHAASIVAEAIKAHRSEEEELEQTANLLGGVKLVFGRNMPKNRLELHVALAVGLRAKGIVHLMDHLSFVADDKAVLTAIGLSQRTLLRYKGFKDKRLDAERSSRAWKFAEVLAKATSVFGSQEEAERWLVRPATGLDRQRPIDLLETQPGTEIVEQFLERIDHGAYS